MKGSAARQISPKRVPGGATPCMTNSNRPNGGVVKLISIASSMITANQISFMSIARPKSRPCTIGKKIGTVSSIIASWSMNMPSSRRMPNIISSMT